MDYLNHAGNVKVNKDKGMTLVEVIISLLILMIIFVPLLGSFTAASKLTVAARQDLYASNLADNVMESVKTLGIEGVAFQFYGSPTDFMLGDGVTAFGEDISGGVASSVYTDGAGHQVFDSSRKTKPYVYQMTGARQGTGTYDVTVTFSSAAYTTAAAPLTGPSLAPSPAPELLPNDYNYADLSAFNAASTALINPKNSGTDYDYLAKTYFKELHESYYYDEWTAACEEVNNANDVIYRAYEQACDDATAAGNPLPPAPVVTPLPTPKATLDDAALNDRITKTTTIEISKVTDVSGNNPKYNLNSYVTYTFNNILMNGAVVEGVCADPVSTELTRNYVGFCDNVKSNLLDSVFLLYTPFFGASDLTHDKVKVVNQVAEDFDIYLVLQAPADTSFTSDLPVEVSGSASTLKLHSQARLSVSGAGATTSNGTDSADRLITELDVDHARIYEVTVNVYEGGSGFTKLLRTLSSSILSD